MIKMLSIFQPYALALLRFISGYVFFLYGSAKLFSVPHLRMFDDLDLISLMGFSGALEFAGGLLIMLGLFTRVTAFILSGQMAVAYLMFHARIDDFWLPITNAGEISLIFCFIFFFFIFSGAGALALDRYVFGES